MCPLVSEAWTSCPPLESYLNCKDWESGEEVREDKCEVSGATAFDFTEITTNILL